MTFALSTRSLKALEGVHSDLVAIVHGALEISTLDFCVIEGIRSIERQKELLASGASRTLKSRHITGHAVDLAPIVGGTIRWDWPLFPKIATAMKASANNLGLIIVWGGDWKTFRDGPHFELPYKEYPA